MSDGSYTGIIVKLLGGFYYVEANDNLYECKARGVFRKKSSSPVVGDRVKISVPDKGFCAIEEILTRKNFIVRPPLANVDVLLLVVSTTEPSPNYLVIDKMIATAESKGIEPLIVFTKTDLMENNTIENLYRNAGFEVFTNCDSTRDKLLKLMEGKLCALSGNTGVGKSTLINKLFPDLNLQTGEISKKLGRGKHTTRSVELFKKNGGYIADTPGFSTVDLERYEVIKKDMLEHCFREFGDYLGQCKFSSCSHVCEKGCAVLAAVEEGSIAKSRHDSYVAMYNEIKSIKEWEQ